MQPMLLFIPIFYTVTSKLVLRHGGRHVQPKKAFKALSTIRSVFNDLLNEHMIVVWIVSGMKELLHFPIELLPVAIHQSICTRVRVKDASDGYAKFSLDVTCLLM